MKEDFLHYVWKFQKFAGLDFCTTNGEKLHIRNPGSQNENAGPDFFNSQIELDEQLWAGNVEIHIKSSDWYAHGHETDPAYDNVILHVVWEHDAEIYRKDGSPISTFAIKEYVPKISLEQYQNLFSKRPKWINCENELGDVDSFILENWLERLYLERLQKKHARVAQELADSQNHWEGLLFSMLCKNFGLKVNSESFFSIAKSVDFAIVKKCARDRLELESLLFGQAGLLEGDKEDWYFKMLKNQYGFLQQKFDLRNDQIIVPVFFRLRPPNFPTLRLAQLAMLYSERNNLFSEVIAADKMKAFYDLFHVAASEYWDTHYNFGLCSMVRKKRISKNFIELLVINTIIPIKFSYAVHQGQDISDSILQLASEIPSEDNSIIKKFKSIRSISKNALQSQALLQLKSEYCDKNKCLQCAVGNWIVGRPNRNPVNK